MTKDVLWGRPGDGRGTMLIVAIDGPAGAGKSTVGRALAKRLGLEYLDTGAMYRGVTLAAFNRGIDVHDDEAVAAILPNLDLVVDDRIVLVDGDDATSEIRGRDVTAAVSVVAANSAVRAELVARQRQWAGDHGGGVIEGRDIGSVVFPDAALKLYITASPRVRAQRRVGDIGGDVVEVESSIIERDRLDSSRADSPLREPQGATLIDTSDRPVDAIVDEIVEMLPPHDQGGGRE
jgi:cytidylate kinase